MQNVRQSLYLFILSWLLCNAAKTARLVALAMTMSSFYTATLMLGCHCCFYFCCCCSRSSKIAKAYCWRRPAPKTVRPLLDTALVDRCSVRGAGRIATENTPPRTCRLIHAPLQPWLFQCSCNERQTSSPWSLVLLDAVALQSALRATGGVSQQNFMTGINEEARSPGFGRSQPDCQKLEQKLSRGRIMEKLLQKSRVWVCGRVEAPRKVALGALLESCPKQ